MSPAGSSSPSATARATRSRSGAGGRSAVERRDRRGQPPDPLVQARHPLPGREWLEELQTLGRTQELRRHDPLRIGQIRPP